MDTSYCISLPAYSQHHKINVCKWHFVDKILPLDTPRMWSVSSTNRCREWYKYTVFLSLHILYWLGKFGQIWLLLLTVLQIISFLIIARGAITSKFVIYEELFNPILSDSFGFTVKDTSYFFVLLLPTHIGAFIVWVSEQLYCFSYLLVAIMSCCIGLLVTPDKKDL